MTRLAELLPFNAGETVASYCSRLAVACGYRHSRSFANDLGFRFQGLVVGDDLDVQKFASVLGAPASKLSPGVIVTENRISTVFGQKLTRALMERSRLRLCPLCIRDDERNLAGRKGFRPYGRIEWLVCPIRTCETHGTKLITPTGEDARQYMHDFAVNLAIAAANIEDLLSRAEAMDTDSLQGYVQARLRGTPTGSPWLDTLPLYVAVRLCEIVGASERHGIRFQAKDLSNRELSAAAGTGFDLLSGGADEFRGWLLRKSQGFYRKNSDLGGRFLFGRLYEKLAYETEDDEYDPIRHIMRDVAINTLPLGPGEEFFGPVTERRIHSVHSASREYDIHPARLTKLLAAAGLITEVASKRTFEKILVDAGTMESFVTEAKKSLSTNEAKAALNAKGTQFEQLVKLGYINADVADETGAFALVNRHSPEDITEFLRKLQSAVTCEDDGSLIDLQVARKKAICTFGKLIELLFGGKLARVAVASGEHGLRAIRVDIDEVKEHTTGANHDGIPIHKLVNLMPSSSKIIRVLLANKRIPTVKLRNPVTRNLQDYVDPKDLAAFMREFVSLGSLSTQAGLRTWTVEKELFGRGVIPIFVAGEMPFYRRSEAETAY
jgi:hypothetical protein